VYRVDGYKQYLCILLGSEYWFLETLFRKARYIVFPNLLLDYLKELKGFQGMPRRNLCLVYDSLLNRFVGAVHGLDIALGIQLNEFYKENVYGVTVPVEWFWDKWGGEGIGFIHTKPRYIARFSKYLETSIIKNIVQEVSGDRDVDVEGLLEEAMLSGIAVTNIDNVYLFAEKLWRTQDYNPLKQAKANQQLELSRILKEIGIANNYTVNIEKSRKEIEIKWITNNKVKTFRICSCRDALKIVEKVHGKECMEIWIAIYDVEKGSQCVSTKDRGIKVVGWREVLDIYRSFSIVMDIFY